MALIIRMKPGEALVIETSSGERAEILLDIVYNQAPRGGKELLAVVNGDRAVRVYNRDRKPKRPLPAHPESSPTEPPQEMAS